MNAPRPPGLALDGSYAALSSSSGEPLARLSLLSAFDRTDGIDETLAVETKLDGDTLLVERQSTMWDRAGASVVSGDGRIEVRSWVEGTGRLGDVHLLGGRSIAPGRTGFMPSGTEAKTLLTPNPGDPHRLSLHVGESAVIGVSGDAGPGRGHWFFTPAPLLFVLDELGIGLVAPVEELRFAQAEYRPSDRGFHLVLDYQGHTSVEGRFAAPPVVLYPGTPDLSEGIRRYREDLEVPARTAETAAWWSEPIFCGWGAQCYLASMNGNCPAAEATQGNYDTFLEALARQGVVPGTITIDDKWQVAYGTNEPDLAKWPDLESWIAARHDRAQRVLLWWKAWDPEGLAPALCICNADGRPVAVDPTNPRTRDLLQESVHTLLSADRLDADGFKIDFTASTPSGTGLSLRGETWGIALLHELLEVLYTAAKNAKADALVITQTPHPSFVDVTDMIRLNDMLRLGDAGPYPPVVPQMRYRAAVARAACPELLVDTDDWAVPDKRTWRNYLDAKGELGVPSLYYATHLDLTGEPFDQDDYEALKRSWARWRTQ
jgi:hypothetical protein